MRLPADSKITADGPEVSERRSISGGVTPRAVGIGLLMVFLIVGMTQILSIRYSAAEVGGQAPPPAPIYLLFLYALLAGPFLTRWNRRLALSRGELLLIYAMMLVAGPICHPYAIGFLIPHTVAPLYFKAQEPGWRPFLSALPSWFAPRDPEAVKQFFQGGDGTVPWHSWLIPMLAWSSLLIVLFFVMLCINVLIRQQWVDSERLTFPLAAIPLALTEGCRTDEGLRQPGSQTSSVFASLGQPSQLLRQPLFWGGILMPLLLQAPGMIHQYLPSMPDLPLRNVILLHSNSGIHPPWNGIGEIEFDLIFWLVGIVYLLPKELAFSAWFFYLIRLLENVTAVWRGVSGEAPSVYSNEFPALFAQGAGAAFALIGITLWMARRHLAAALRRAMQRGAAAENDGEFLSYRTAFIGAVLGTLFILGWLCLAGMRLWVAALFFGLMLGYFFIFARIRAETGLGMGVILYPMILDEVMMTLVGARYLTLPDLIGIYALRWIYHSSATGSVMAAQLEGFKLVDVGGLRGRRVGWTLALAVTLTVPLAFAWTLQTYYSRGFQAMPMGQRETSMVGSQIYWSYQNLVTSRNEAGGPQWGGILAMGTGALVTITLSGLRSRFLWFPLHPVGYMAANSWGMHINWASFGIGWLINVLITRYGGLPTYRRLLPLFFGFIVGDMLHEGLWGLVAWAVGGSAAGGF